ncbi:helix-turn-helix domain-containing protein [bacterium]|nr:helix-turn-helix domain-containing protein [bacterium]
MKQQQDNNIADPLLDRIQAAEYYNCSPGTLDKWASIGRGPKFVKIGRLRRYRQSDLDAYIAEGN